MSSTEKNGSADTEAELDVEKFKAMMRTSMNEGLDDSLNRSQEFVGGGTFSPRTGRSSRPKVKAGVLNSPDRPGEWLGSPASGKRKSYKVKNHLPNVMSPNLDGESAHSGKSASQPPLRNDSGKPPVGVTKHTLGSSSSHHESNFASDPLVKGSNHSINDLAPDPEKFKAMMRESINQQEDLNRSQEFLGGSDHGLPKSSPQGSFNNSRGSKNVPHKWGAPESPEQFRPDGWLGSPASATRKSYTVKNSSPMVSPIPNLDDDDAPKKTVPILPKSPLLSASPARKLQKGKMKAQSIAIGATAPKFSPKTSPKRSSATNSGRPAGPPVKSQSLGLGQKSPFMGSPIQRHERVDRKKFLSSFSAFEGQTPEPSPTKASPKPNFKVSNAAKAKSISLRNSASDLKSSSHHGAGDRPPRDWTPLNQTISQLRKVALKKPPKDDICEQQAWEIVQFAKYLKHDRVADDEIKGSDAFLSVVQNLRRESIMAAHMTTKELDEISGPILESMEAIAGKMDYQQPHRLELEICARILNQLSDSNPRSASMLEDVIGRLKNIPNDDLKQVTQRLEDICWAMGERESNELANIIRNSEDVDMKDDSTQWDEVTMVLCSLDQLVDDVSQFGGMGESTTSFSMAEYSPRGRDTIISPKGSVKRNFIVSEAAKRKSMAVLDLSIHSDKSEPEDELQNVLASLKRVVITPKDVDKSGQQASELLQMVQLLEERGGGQGVQKEICDLFEDLNQQGVFSSNLGPNRIEKMQNIIKQLIELSRKTDYNPDAKEELAGTVKILRKLTPTSAGAVEWIQQAIDRLRKVVPSLKEPETAGAEDAMDQLQQVLLSMREGQEAELAEAIRDLKGDEETKQDNKMDDLEHVLAGLKAKRSAAKKVAEEEAKEIANRAKARVTPEDADYLVYSLLKLKKAKMSKTEAAAVAGFLRMLKPVQTPEDEKESDEALAKLRKVIDTNKKSKEILRVLKGLRRLNLNDPERFELAEIVRSLGKGEGKYRDEIGNAIAKLRNVRMTRPEAKEAAGIMFNLRKTKKGNSFDIDKSREMVNLRKVMKDEKADVVVEAFRELAKVDLSEKEIDEFAGIVSELEVQPLGPTEHQLITIEYKVSRNAKLNHSTLESWMAPNDV
jgi:hypothetical protein